MWMLEHLSRHSHGFYTFFCAGKVFPYLDGDILPVQEGKHTGIVFNTDSSGKFPAFCVSHGHFPPENARKCPHSRGKNVLPGSYWKSLRHKTKDLAILKCCL
jgi:hypothetical protein